MKDYSHILPELDKLLTNRKGANFYCEKLGITPQELADLKLILQEIKNAAYSANILFLDIETAPLMAYVFQKQVWKANVAPKHVISDWYMLSWAAKWLDEDEMMSEALTAKEAYLGDDKRIVVDLWKLFDKADIIIAHNCGFDLPNSNTRFVYHQLPPPSPFKQIDTLKVAQKEFGFTHNSLEGLATFFGLQAKGNVDFDLWKKCMAGDAKALKNMEEYNRGDVYILEKLYYKLRPYIKGHPNLDLYIDSEESVCPVCGSTDIYPVSDKYFYTQTLRYELFRCNNCRAFSRKKQSEKFLHKKKISAIPR